VQAGFQPALRHKPFDVCFHLLQPGECLCRGVATDVHLDLVAPDCARQSAAPAHARVKYHTALLRQKLVVDRAGSARPEIAHPLRPGMDAQLFADRRVRDARVIPQSLLDDFTEEGVVIERFDYGALSVATDGDRMRVIAPRKLQGVHRLTDEWPVYQIFVPILDQLAQFRSLFVVR
jgi:hypothetical protein